MPQLTSETPDVAAAELVEAFRAFPQLKDLCGEPHAAVLQPGLTNRVFRLQAELGDFFLRLPAPGSAGTVNRMAEAHNLKLAVELDLAVPALFCDVSSGILLTRALIVADRPPANLAWRIGAVLGRLHASGAVFQDVLSPDAVLATQRQSLSGQPGLLRDFALLERALVDAGGGEETLVRVPSHGDPSPGNFLATADRLWLIDWEYSAMADPAWDLAYAILEHGFTGDREGHLLEGYRAAGALCPTPARLEVMKAKCDAVSACWALEQLAAGREEEIYRPFAAARHDRALRRLQDMLN
ncbi:choline/ethanolamine kinase family protein [Roseibium sp. Sym1]|uniref:choline/ethanolamine kinase family protein n=1 Tax=Roseibium sp. Sym1 TaxID=3016006 RepID=UPI0022B40A52|nr:choline/ethanolamine kinase family protein [Roseibium sp. Sym1]